LVFFGIKEIAIAKNTSITLGEHFEGFITSQIQSGRYGSVSEVIRSALRLLEIQETKMNTLRQLLVEGEESGMADYDLNSFINELDSEEKI
jgi:antitoxin ParD1/3/4